MIYEVVSERGRWGPISADHPAVQDLNLLCPECNEPIKTGDIPAFVNPMPDDAEDFVKAAAGKPYTASVVLAHESCVEKYR